MIHSAAETPYFSVGRRTPKISSF